MNAKQNIFRLGVKTLIQYLMGGLVNTLTRFSVGRYILDVIVRRRVESYRNIPFSGGVIRLVCPNQLITARCSSFYLKEPETIDWIDNIPRDGVLWDVGANVGLYSCYAALSRGVPVVAFEPSVFNLEFLARNVVNNHLTDQVTIVPLPIYERNCNDNYYLTSTEWGGALSSFGAQTAHDGNRIESSFVYNTVGCNLDRAKEFFDLPSPTHIKIDVDGVEHLILSGAESLLDTVTSISVEVNDNFDLQRVAVHNTLSSHGFSLVRKAHAEIYDGSPEWGATYNQHWERAR